MELRLSLNQKQMLSQRMQLSVKILQMDWLGLEQYVKEAVLENPMIELEIPDGDIEDIKAGRLKKLEWLDSMDESNPYSYTYNYDEQEREQPIYEKNAADNLRSTLIAQVPGFHLDPEQERIVRYLIDDLDDNGYLSSKHSQLTRNLNIDEKQLEAALGFLWKMDPPGVGAQDLRECLLIQAKRQDNPFPVLIEIIESHLDILAKNQLAKLAKTLGVTIEAIKEARSRLLSLNPKPGNGYSSYKSIPYIRPDLFIVHFEGEFQIIFNDFNQIQIMINRAYEEIVKNGDAEAANYIHDKINKAEWLVSCIAQRKNTILRCTEKILRWQIRFFERGPGNIIPMTLSDIATQLELHPSTVSRAVNGKYLQCQWGVFGLGDFFSRTVSVAEPNRSNDTLAIMVKQLISKEDKSKPFSDQQLVIELEKTGISVARRTVAKYREKMHIPPAAMRKEYQ